MSAVLSDVPPTRYQLDIDQYHRMGERGILRPEDRVELIDGELVRMAPIGSKHGGLVSRLNRLLVQRVDGVGIVSPQNALILSRVTEPQPDLAVLRWRADDYIASTPWAPDALLVIEVSDSSLHYDRHVKLKYYAASGVPQVWIVDVRGLQVLDCRDPGPDGYARIEAVGAGTMLQALAVTGLRVAVDEVFAGV